LDLDRSLRAASRSRSTPARRRSRLSQSSTTTGDRHLPGRLARADRLGDLHRGLHHHAGRRGRRVGDNTRTATGSRRPARQ
jgi:hypothetical protein